MRQCRQKKTCLIKSHHKGATKIPEVKAVQLLQLPVQLSGLRPKRSSLPCTSPGTGRRIGDVSTGRFWTDVRRGRRSVWRTWPRSTSSPSQVWSVGVSTCWTKWLSVKQLLISSHIFLLHRPIVYSLTIYILEIYIQIENSHCSKRIINDLDFRITNLL